MAEALPPTLAELRDSVLIRSGYNTTDGTAGTRYPLVDELLRKSQKQLWLKAPWLRNYKRVTQPLIADTQDYDLPDDCAISDMGRVSVVNADGKQYPLEYGDGAIRNITATSNQPLWYEIQDQMLRMYPAPDSTWTTLVYEYHSGPTPLVAETDRPAVDGEALIQRAVAYMKKQTGFGGDWKSDWDEHIDYITDLCARQGVVRALDMRGTIGARNRWLRPSIGTGAPYTSYWAPWQ